jgi:signal transduction histidine kinase/DNA-binding response OmpR family regulator/HPt (histidine-containing phosphotransfer) domain-containing protein
MHGPRFFCTQVLLVLLLAVLPRFGLAAPATLMLDDAHPHVEAWPAITVLHDPAGTLVADALLRAPERFGMPPGAYATLGMQDGASWLHIPVMTAPGSDDGWLLKIDFGLLNHVDFYLARDGRIVAHRAADSGQVPAGPPGTIGGRVPAFMMHLRPGVQYEILLRVESLSAKILPVSFEKPFAFHAAAMNEQLLQGMLTGLTLCLLLYSLAQWINLRENLFAKYSLLVGGLAFYNLAWFGYGTEYLWGGSPWAALRMPGVIALLTSCGAYLFVEQALARPGKDRIFSRLMKTGALLCVASALAWGLDLIGMKAVVGIISTLGVLPMLLGLPGAFRRARNRDKVGTYFLVGWAVSFVCSALQGQVCTGMLDANYWTMHLTQFGSTFDMLIFMRILGLRTRDIQDAMLRAEAATRMKSEFLANMSHEIRTPMNAIIGMSRLALMADPNPKLRNYLGKILGAGEHLLGIINDILDFSKIEAGRMTLERVPFDLDEMLEHLAGITAIKTEARHIELVFKVPKGVPARLVGDPLRLGQVLINLTGNAVKFTEQGEIVVAVDVLERVADEVLLGFSVTDTGIGMDAAQVSQLFQSFTQADNSVSRKYGGTGLGLSISKQLVELMGGSISVSSTPGVGSRFSFTVRMGVALDDAQSAPAHADGLPQAMRVLVVDDCASARDALAAMLEGFGVRAETVDSGEAALARLAQAAQTGQPYEVVLMDYLMPGMDGVETIRRIHADSRLAAPPAVLMVSAVGREGVLQHEGELPLSGFLTKPVAPSLLYNSLLQVLRPHAAAPGGSPADAPADTLANKPAQDLSRLDGARILLVDDNANNREVALDFLAAARMQVDVATGGAEAVDMVLRGDYDLVLMDIQMHEVDGLSATRRIRALPEFAALPIVAMTAHAMAGDREKSLAAGMNDHVVKPIDPGLLFAALLRWIDPRRLQGRALPAIMPVETDDDPGGADALPPIRGIDWDAALARAGGRPARLRRRIAGFVQEYGDAPARLRAALAQDDDVRLAVIAHNLKSGAAYIGAEALSAAAATLELELRSGRRERLPLLAPELAGALEDTLAGLMHVAARPPQDGVKGANIGAAGLAALVARLDGFLAFDDARAEDALDELQACLPARLGLDAAALLDALRTAVHEIEYEAARAHLAKLAALTDKLETSMEAEA